VAGVEEAHQLDPPGHRPQVLRQIVVGQGVVPGEIVGDQHLVHVVGLVAVAVRHLGPVGRHEERHRVAGGGALKHAVKGPQQRAPGGLPVPQHLDVALREAVAARQRIGPVDHVVDATPERGHR
jgi:hypothetical protein